jgi:hypothetical protein
VGGSPVGYVIYNNILRSRFLERKEREEEALYIYKTLLSISNRRIIESFNY